MGEDRLQGVGACLYVEKVENGRIFLSTLLSAPIFTSFKDEVDPTTVEGLRNTYGCTKASLKVTFVGPFFPIIVINHLPQLLDFAKSPETSAKANGTPVPLS